MITPKNFPYPDDPSRNGEKIVFDILKEIYKDEKDFDIFYNREIWSPYNPNIPEEAEADFIIFHANLGYVVIEVKGGNPIEYIAEENQWYSTDKNKIRHKIKNPVKQAKKCRWIIREKIKEVFKGKESPWINAKILVIFPESGKPDSIIGAEYHSSNFLCKSELEDLPSHINKILLSRDRDPNTYYDKPGQSIRDIFFKLFAQDIKFDLSFKDKLSDLKKKIIEFDKKQLSVLEFNKKNPRLIIEGRAGTGKSNLAAKKVEQFSESFKKVLFICGANKPFGIQISKKLEEKKNVDVFYFSGLCKELYDKARITTEEIEEVIKDKILSDLPIYEKHQRLLEKSIQKTGIKYEALVVDEGQDITKAQWESLLWILNDPYESPVYIFHDNNQKVYSKSTTDLPDFPKHPNLLETNYRNSKDIFATQKSYYEGESTISGGPRGEPVAYHIVNTREEAERKIVNLINKYIISEGIDKKEIAVLTGNNKGTYSSILGNYFLKGKKGLKYKNLFFVRAEQNDEDEIVFDSIKRYKGLEREIVILFDLEDALNNPEEMYIGLSRPKLILDIIGTEKNIDMLKKISEEN